MRIYEQVKMACREVVKEKGLDRITVEDLVQVKTYPYLNFVTGTAVQIFSAQCKSFPTRRKNLQFYCIICHTMCTATRCII